MSEAWWAYGSRFLIGAVAVAEIQDISGPGMSKDAIEVTHQDGTAGDGYRKFLSGWRDGGEVSINANWIPKAVSQAGASGILAKFESDDLQEYTIEVPADGTSSIDIVFNGIVTAFTCDLPMEEQGKLDFTVKVSGKVTVD